MKRTIIAISLLISVSTFAQKKDTVTSKAPDKKKDSIAVLPAFNPSQFAILYALIVSPDDVSVNQVKMLKEWLEKGIMVLPKELFEKKQK